MKMYYEIHGQGEPLLLLYYFDGTGVIWKPVIEELAKQYRLIIPDLRGHGRSTNPMKEFTHRQAALDVHALLERLKINPYPRQEFSTRPAVFRKGVCANGRYDRSLRAS